MGNFRTLTTDGSAPDDCVMWCCLINTSSNVFQIFQVRLECVTDLWAGSIEVGVTSHNPDDIVLLPTMTSMPTGTWMLSGASIIVDGKEVKRDYSSINLETLQVLW